MTTSASAKKAWDSRGRGAGKPMAKVQHGGDVGYRIADIGPGGKESNVQTNAAWDGHAAKAAASNIKAVHGKKS